LYVLANPSIGELQGAGFYWIPDLSFPDLQTGMGWITTSFQAQDWGKLLAYFSLPIIMLITQMALQKMSTPPKDGKGTADAQTQMMSQMMFFMPIMFGYITLGLPSGLTLYWTVSNVLSIIQQYFVAGWGGLVEWLPFLKRELKEPQPIGRTAAPPPTTISASPRPAGRLPDSGGTAAPPTTTTPQPTRPVIKRRSKRRK
jgi:hypothetical protein